MFKTYGYKSVMKLLDVGVLSFLIIILNLKLIYYTIFLFSFSII